MTCQRGWTGRTPNYAVELSKDYPNIHLELCQSGVWGGVMEKLVEIGGADRIVYGSDTVDVIDPDQWFLQRPCERLGGGDSNEK